MRTHLVRIGNSQGVRLPKPLIAQAGLTDEVELLVRDGRIIIARSTSTRQGWAEAAAAMAARGDVALLDAPTSTRFDREDWKW